MYDWYLSVILSTYVVTENQISPPAPNVTPLIKDVPANTQHIPITEETPPGPITYASILKAPLPVATNTPNTSQSVTQQTEVVNTVNEDKKLKEKTQQSKFTYSRALISTVRSRDLAWVADTSIENPEDSMDVDAPQKNLSQLQNNVTLPTHPITYSQVLRSKHPVINAIPTEVVNEQDNICKETAPINLTYSQVLSGKKVDTPDKNILINGLNETVGLTNHNTPYNTPYDPQNKVPL